MRELFFVSCTKGVKEETDLYRSLTKLGCDQYHFVENNRRGLSACYNQFLDDYVGSETILVLVHDDVTVADVFVQEKLNEAVESFNIVGLAGSSDFNLHDDPEIVSWLAGPEKSLSGAVEHRHSDGRNAWRYFGYTPKRCAVLDGLFLAIDMTKIGDVRFDEQFSFHMYDIDFCLSAVKNDLSLGTTNIYVQHRSVGDYRGEEYRQAVKVLRNKWQE